jgi:hypothetical protein
MKITVESYTPPQSITYEATEAAPIPVIGDWLLFGDDSSFAPFQVGSRGFFYNSGNLRIVLYPPKA